MSGRKQFHHHHAPSQQTRERIPGIKKQKNAWQETIVPHHVACVAKARELAHLCVLLLRMCSLMFWAKGVTDLYYYFLLHSLLLLFPFFYLECVLSCSEPVFHSAYPSAQASKEASERANSRATPSHIDDNVPPKKPEGQDAAQQGRLTATDNDTSHTAPTAQATSGVRGADKYSDTKKASAEPLVTPMLPAPAPLASPVSLSLSLSLARARARGLSLSLSLSLSRARAVSLSLIICSEPFCSINHVFLL